MRPIAKSIQCGLPLGAHGRWWSVDLVRSLEHVLYFSGDDLREPLEVVVILCGLGCKWAFALNGGGLDAKESKRDEDAM